MAHGSHLDSVALRVLTAGGGQPDFVPAKIGVAADKPRDRIWELAENLHCSIVGTCLTNAEARTLLAKLGEPDARTMSEHRLHGQVVYLAGRREGGAKLLQKMLDRRHDREIRRFDKAGTVDEVRALWRASLDRGEIPGAYWAVITHPATSWELVQDIFGEVHMLSHLVGQSNRIDIRRLRQLEEDLAERDERITAQEARIFELMEQREAIGAQNRTLVVRAAVQAVAAVPDTIDREAIESLKLRLARERAHAEALEEKLAVLTQVSARLSAELEKEITRRQATEGELAAVETLLGTDDDVTDAGVRRDAVHLVDRTFLYVGGRPRQVAQLRRFVEERQGRLLCHDGGIEDSMSLLAGLVRRSDLVLFPVECVSHEATGLVKRHCEASGRSFRPVRSASLASFVQAVMQTTPPI